MTVRRDIRVSVARDLTDLLQAFALRSMVYMGEQECPYGEEFDGNDFAGATHLIAQCAEEPVGAMRLRWFADFFKIERVAVSPRSRGGEIVKALTEEAVRVGAMKGYTRCLGHIQARLLPMWRRLLKVRVLEGRPPLVFSDHEYLEVMCEIARPSDAISLSTPPLVILRPEGAWGEPGVLERSAQRVATNPGVDRRPAANAMRAVETAA